MKKRLIVTSLLILLLGGSSTLYYTSIPQPQGAVVKIGRWCTGFAVKEGYVMTAAHCMIKIDSLTGEPMPANVGDDMIVTTPSNEVRLFAVAAISDTADVAILKGPTTGLTITPISKDYIELDQTYTAMGHPLMSPQIIPLKLVYKFWIGTYYVFQGLAEGGYSGSPIFNDKGEVVALLVARTHSFTLGVAGPYLQALLNTLP